MYVFPCCPFFCRFSFSLSFGLILAHTFCVHLRSLASLSHTCSTNKPRMRVLDDFCYHSSAVHKLSAQMLAHSLDGLALLLFPSLSFSLAPFHWAKLNKHILCMCVACTKIPIHKPLILMPLPLLLHTRTDGLASGNVDFLSVLYIDLTLQYFFSFLLSEILLCTHTHTRVHVRSLWTMVTISKYAPEKPRCSKS